MEDFREADDRVEWRGLVLRGTNEVVTVGVEDLPIARDEELRALRMTVTFGGGPRIAVVVGEAGIGKTTLWRAAIDAALAEGVEVRATAAVESEASFARPVGSG